VVDRERLAGLASFDGNYLNMPQLLSHWQVRIESALTPVERSPAMWRPPTSATRVCSKSAAQRVDRKRQRVSPLVEQLRIRPPCAPALAVTPRRRKSAASLATVLIA
jgi:hypothetical protein